MPITTKTMTDHRGRDIPAEYVKPHEKARDKLVRSIARDADALRARIAAFRDQSLARVIAFADGVGEKYDVEMGGEKGNITLTSFDRLIKVQVAIQDTITFDERLSVAQALITEYLAEISVGADPALVELVHKAFYADSAGRLRTGQVLGLRSINIKHPKWLKAMDAIGDAIIVQSSKQYVRVYSRPEYTADWQLIRLDIAGA